MDALLLAVVDELGGGVVGVELDLVDGGDGLARLVLEEDLQVLDGEVGDTDVLDAARGRQLLELSSGCVLADLQISGLIRIAYQVSTKFQSG